MIIRTSEGSEWAEIVCEGCGEKGKVKLGNLHRLSRGEMDQIWLDNGEKTEEGVK